MLNNTASAIATKSAALTPDDAGVIIAHGVFVGTGGTIVVTLREGQIGTFINIASGSVLPISITRLWATGTTASNIVGLG